MCYGVHRRRISTQYCEYDDTFADMPVEGQQMPFGTPIAFTTFPQQMCAEGTAMTLYPTPHMANVLDVLQQTS
jgi:hypothetical protein